MAQITIALALYKPNMRWLEEELQSIEYQTYQDFKLLVWNDCPEDEKDYLPVFRKYLSRIPVSVYKGEENLGSNGAFEKLTELTDTPYIAYCDQDDVWLPEKLEMLKSAIEKRDVDLVCSNMNVIDAGDHLVAKRIEDVRPHQKAPRGNDLFSTLLSRNFVTGCTILMRTSCAKAAIPFANNLYHDHWLAICAAMGKGIYMIQKSLINYRISGENQTATLKGIRTKEDYYKHKILLDDKRLQEIGARIHATGIYREAIMERKRWVAFRKNYVQEPSFSSFLQLYGKRKCGMGITFFELVLPFMPDRLFSKLIFNIQKGKI